METAAAVVGFVGLAGPFAQGLKLLYDFKTNMKECPKDIREMKTDLELVTAYDVLEGKRKRWKFAAKVDQTQKLRASLDRTKTIMFEFKSQLQR